MVAAIQHVDRTVPLEAPEGIVLRYGSFYGPGASDVLLEMLRKRRRSRRSAVARLASITSWTTTRRHAACWAWMA